MKDGGVPGPSPEPSPEGGARAENRDRDARFRALVESNPGQATVDEYLLVDRVLQLRAPCRFLVFGVGRDSSLWIHGNQGGTTVFLEDIAKWAAFAREAVPGITVHDVRYRTLRALWPIYRRFPSALGLGGLPQSVMDLRWDVILVDAPRGTRWYRPGRMKSVYAASKLGAPGADVFVHDCHRKVERESADAYLGTRQLISQAGSMRHYRLGGS